MFACRQKNDMIIVDISINGEMIYASKTSIDAIIPTASDLFSDRYDFEVDICGIKPDDLSHVVDVIIALINSTTLGTLGSAKIPSKISIKDRFICLKFIDKHITSQDYSMKKIIKQYIQLLSNIDISQKDLAKDDIFNLLIAKKYSLVGGFDTRTNIAEIITDLLSKSRMSKYFKVSSTGLSTGDNFICEKGLVYIPNIYDDTHLRHGYVVNMYKLISKTAKRKDIHKDVGLGKYPEIEYYCKKYDIPVIKYILEYFDSIMVE